MFIHIVLWSMLVVPWFSLLLVKLSSVKHYMPVVLLSVLVLTVVQETAYSQKWWENMDWIVPWGNISNVSLIFGFFAVGTFWIFYFTYGSFWLFFLTNVAIDGLWLIFAPPYLERIQVFRFVNMGAWGLFLISIGSSLILYGYQMWQETIFQEEPTGDNGPILKKWLKRLIDRREPAR